MNAARERPWLQQYGHAPAAIEVPQATLLEQFLGHAVARPEDPCVVYLDTVVTYVTMIGLAERVAAHLDDLGVRAGERIAIQFDNSPAFVASLLGVWMRRATAVLLNPLYRRNELQHIIEDSRPKGILCSVETRDALHELGSVAAGPGFVSVVDDRALLDDPLAWSGAMLPVDDVGSSTTLVLDQSLPGEIILNADRWPVPGNAAADVAALIYTSGTTGPPKGAMLSHGNLAFTSAIHVPWLEMSASDRVLCVAPLAHVTGLVQGFGLSATGGVPILLTHRFDPAVIATVVRQQQATVTISAPAALYRLVDDEAVTREDLASLRAVFAGGAALSPQLIERFGDRFGIYIHHIYGLTEAASPCHAVPFGATAPIDRKLGTVSIGVPMPNTDARVLGEDGCALGPDEVGQLQITGPGMFAGYWEDPVATAATIEDGWLDTGDVGYYDAEGWFFLVGRRGDIINVAGYKVWPPEVESVLMEHDAVVEAVVVGFPDQTRGSSVGAAISTRCPVTIAELEEHCIQRLAPYKRPRRVAMFSEIPRNPNGKIQRAEIAELLGHGVNE